MLKIALSFEFIGLILVISGSISEYTDYEYLERKFGKIIHVSAMFRHGDRSPSADYPLDPYRSYPWPDGRGQLLQKGKRRLIQLGKWFRKRYARVIKNITSSTNITVHSSDYDRNIMSAQCLMAGFYKARKSEIFDRNLRWHPVPIHSIQKEYDQIIAFERSCPAYGYYRKKYFQVSQKVKKIYERNKELFKYLQNHTGFELPGNDMLICERRIKKIYDTLVTQKENRLKLPAWSEKVFPQPLTSMSINLINSELAWFKPKKLWTGTFFKTMIKDMMQRINHISTQIFHLYSGHGSTIAAIMRGLKIFNWIIPPYGSSLIFELRQKEKSYFTTVLFKNTTKQSPHLMCLPACDNRKSCSFEKFYQITSHFFLKDWNTECKIPS